MVGTVRLDVAGPREDPGGGAGPAEGDEPSGMTSRTGPTDGRARPERNRPGEVGLERGGPAGPARTMARRRGWARRATGRCGQEPIIGATLSMRSSTNLSIFWKNWLSVKMCSRTRARATTTKTEATASQTGVLRRPLTFLGALA